MSRIVDSRWRTSARYTLLSCLPLALAAQAQEAPRSSAAPPSGPEEVVITGSRIARPDLDRLQPTTVVTSEIFDQRAYADIGQALQELPAFGIQPSSAANVQNATGIAQSFVDLYSLGSQRTLVLVNGRRFVSSNSPAFGGGEVSPGQQVDLNVIPTKLIERVETVSVGGAPIYGSDAIAGTVNIILKKDYQGLDVDAGVGAADAGDAWNYRLRALGGTNFADGRGNVTTVFEITKSDGLLGTGRRSYSSDLGFDAPVTPGPFRNVLTPFGTVSSLSTSGVPTVDDAFFLPPQLSNPAALGITNPAGQILAFSPGGALTPYNLGNPTGNPVFWQGGDGVRLSQFSNLLSPLEKINADTLVNFKLNDHLRVFAESWFSETHGEDLITQPAYNTTLFGAAGTVNGAFKVSVNNPFLSPGDQSLIQSALNAYGAATAPADRSDPDWNNQTFYLQRANLDLENGRATATQVLARGVLGMSGDFDVAGHSYSWEVAFNYGYSRNSFATPGYVFQNLENALNATTVAGNIVCAGDPAAAPIKTVSNVCAPLNLFGNGSPSQAALNYITHLAQATTINTQRDSTANLNGDVLKLPGGEWKAAVGFENRREAAKFSPDDFYTGNAQDGFAPFGQLNETAIEGSYVTNEVYAETLIPVFSPSMGIPGLHQVELEGAARHVSNSIAGSATTWTGGLRWSPVPDVQLRGNRTVSIRAPAITELFLPSATSFEFAADPCDHTNVALGTAPATRAKNCAAAGIDTSSFTSNVINATAQGTTSGNSGLQSETAKSKTFGIVLRPRWVPNLSASVDYVEIDIVNAIEQLNLTEILNACYDSTDYPASAYCSQFTRNMQGQITTFHDGFVNAGLRDFEGVTASIDWGGALPANLGHLGVRLAYLDTMKLTEKVGAAAVNDLRGEIQGPLPIAAPKGKGSISLTWDKGPYSVYWEGLYTSSMVFSNSNLPSTQDISGVGQWWLFNASVGYQPTRALTTRFIVNNVFDKEPPFPALAGVTGNFSSATSLYFPGIIGRTYQLTVDYAF